MPQSYIPPTLRKSPNENLGQQSTGNLKSEIDLFNSNIESIGYGSYENKEIIIPHKEIKTSCNIKLILR